MRKNNEVTEMNNSGNFPEELHGVYKGFMPTDESPIATGEFEVLVDSNKIMGRFATGLLIFPKPTIILYEFRMSKEGANKLLLFLYTQ